jgi:molecular chaperone DnaK (HSP70)
MKKDCPFRETLLIDITHLTLGVETDGGIMSPIISKNSIIPISRTVEFTNSENDSSIDINVYQGERRLVKDNFLICKCTLENVPKMQKNLLIIKVTFSINSDGILTVDAKLKNDENKSITIVKNIKSDITLDHKREIEIDEIIKNAEENKLIDSEIN